ncbi:nose resistant to fluoxetine protein 6-like [Pecten maximus]|uniref:nose resistant to fluoxetine protein 6-like n=1 Tax=Pecten maximus TaxID=6579 RepID=UPI001457EF31|nr:nose resistant to fluoxetine protein 6-like [Pecten maximus]
MNITNVRKGNMSNLLFLGILILSSCVNAGGTPDYGKAMEMLRNMANSDHARMTRTTLITELFEGLLGSSQTYINRLKDALSVDMTEVSGENFNISEDCLNDAKQVIIGLERKEQWAIQMLDAMAKPPSDILSGNLYWTGGYEECLAVEGTAFVNMTSNNGPRYQINARQCLGVLQLVSRTHLQDTTILMLYVLMGNSGRYIGFCVPKRCSVEDANRLVNTAFSVFSDTYRITGMVCPEVETEYDTKAIISLLICSIIGLMMVIGTGYDVIIVRRTQKEGNNNISPNSHTTVDNTGASLNESTSLLIKSKSDKAKERDQGILVKIIMAFSVMSNGEKILSTAQGEGSLTALNGMRFLSISWVILGHCFMFALTSPTSKDDLFHRIFGATRISKTGYRTVPLYSDYLYF